MGQIILYKHLLIIFFLFVAFLSPAYAAPELGVVTQGSSSQVNNTIVQNIIVNLKTDAAWKLSIVSLDNSLINLSQPNQSIPINNVYILDNNLANTYYFEPNKTIQIDSGDSVGTFNQKYALRVSSADAAYAGVYSGTFKFTLTSGSDVATYIYNLSFNQPEIKRVNIIPDSLYIKVLPYDAMKKGYNYTTNSPTKILIQSNTNWKLVLKNDAKENSLNCQFKVSSLSGKSKINYGNDFTDLPTQNLIIAEGEPTISSDGKTLDTEVIQVKYLFKSPEGEIQPSDNYNFNVNYDIISE